MHYAFEASIYFFPPFNCGTDIAMVQLHIGFCIFAAIAPPIIVEGKSFT